MQQYQHLLTELFRSGVTRESRNATVVGTFGEHLSFDMRKSFPILTTKKMPFHSIAAEMIGFLRGYDNAAQFEELGTKVWWDNADDPRWKESAAHTGENGYLGRIYGAQWREWRKTVPNYAGMWQTEDQIAEVHRAIQGNPHSRRHVVSAWNPGELDLMCLPPCHILFQLYVDPPYMDLQMYQRSADVFLGLPFNISGYALLLWIMAKTTGYEPRWLHMCLGDVHLYSGHIKQARTVLSRSPSGSAPYIQYQPDVPLTYLKPWDFLPQLFELHNYDPHPKVPAPMIV